MKTVEFITTICSKVKKALLSITTGGTQKNDTIAPDITIVKQENFDDLLFDKKVEKAIHFIRTL